MNIVKIGRLLINLDAIVYVETFDPLVHGAEQADKIVIRFNVAVGNEHSIQLFGIRLEGDDAEELQRVLSSYTKS
jgi:hypothetical protein